MSNLNLSNLFIMVNKTAGRGNRTAGIIFSLKILTSTMIHNFKPDSNQLYPVTIQACSHLAFGNRLQTNDKSQYSESSRYLIMFSFLRRKCACIMLPL